MKALVLAGTLLLFPTTLHAVTSGGLPQLEEESSPSSTLMPRVLREVGYLQRIGHRLPMDLVVRDEQGDEQALGSFFDGRPVVLMPAYYSCPMLCPMTVDGLMRAVRVLAFNPDADYRILVYSFDPENGARQAREQRARAIKRYGHKDRGEDIRFLTASPASVEALNESIGLTVRQDPETGEFAHPAGLVVATPDGVISRYLFGLEPSPRDLRMALVESSAGTLGGLADQVLLYCFAYDPEGGQYNRIALLGLRGAALGTLGIAGTLIGGAIWRERRRNRRRPV